MDKIERLSALIAEVQVAEPGLYIDVKAERILVGFWFQCATGRSVCCGTGDTFAAAYESAVAHRQRDMAKAVIEAEVRAEVERRMAA